MITFAAVMTRETALMSGSGILHGIAPAAIDGFAAGALAAAACSLVVAAPRLLDRTRRSARDGMWGNGLRRSKVQRDNFATPLDVDVDAPPAAVSPARANRATANRARANRATPDRAIPDRATPDRAWANRATSIPAVTSPHVTSADEPGATTFADLFAPEAEVLGFRPTATSELCELSADRYPCGPEVSLDRLSAVDGIDVHLPGTGGDGAGRGQSGRSGHHCKHRVTNWRPAGRSQPRHAAPAMGLATRVSGKFAALPLLARN